MYIVKNSLNHLQRFCDRTQLSGILKYRKSNLEELKALNEVFSKYFLSSFKEKEAVKEKEVMASYSNSILEINWQDNKPKATSEEIFQCFKETEYTEIEDLTIDCRELFRLVRDATEARLQATAGSTYEQVNSAIVLFSAELLQWIKQLAMRPCSETVYQEVVQRLNYLDEVLEKPVFEDEPGSDYAIQLIIFNVTQILEKNVLPKIGWRIDQLSSREHFDNLGRHAQAYLRHAAKALFCLYSDAPGAKKFELATFTLQRNKELELMINTRLGSLFKNLGAVYTALQPYQSESLLKTNLFLDEKGLVRQECLKNLNHSAAAKDDYALGIHPIMNNEKSKIYLITQLGYLNDFGLLIGAFRQAYELAGLGGDCLLYIALCRETHHLLAAFIELLVRSRICFESIFEEHHCLYQKFIVEASEVEWRKHFLTFKLVLRDVIKEMESCQEWLIKIVSAMNRMMQTEYKTELKDKILFFTQTVNEVAQRVQVSSVDERILAIQPSEEVSEPPKIVTQASSVQSLPSFNVVSRNRDTTSLQALMAQSRQLIARSEQGRLPLNVASSNPQIKTLDK